MTARTVRGTVEFPGGSGVPCVNARVVASIYTGVDGDFVHGTVNDVAVGSTAALTNVNGAWSLSLEPNVNITPSGTVWRIVVTPPDGVPVTDYIEVPDVEGPHDVTDLTVDPPGALQSSALTTHINTVGAHSSQRQYQFDVRQYGSVQDAVDAAIAVGGGTVFVDDSTYTENVVVEGGVPVRLLGSGRGVSEIRASSGDVLTLGTDDGSASLFTCEAISLRSLTGGGHVVNVARQIGISGVTFYNVLLNQDNNDKSCFNYDDTDGSGNFIDNLFIAVDTEHTSTATVPSWYLKVGACNRNRWLSSRPTYSGNYVWWIEASSASSYANNNEIDGVTAEVTVGGVVKMLGCRSSRIANVGVYDLQAVGASTSHLFDIGSAGALQSSEITLDGISRHGGTLGTGLHDVKFSNSGVASGCVLINCGGATSLSVDANSKHALVIGGACTYSNDSSVVKLLNIAKPSVSGSRGGNAALASLLTALSNLGLVTDSSSA